MVERVNGTYCVVVSSSTSIIEDIFVFVSCEYRRKSRAVPSSVHGAEAVVIRCQLGVADRVVCGQVGVNT